MITKSELKYYSALLKKKNRLTENKFIVEGLKNVVEGMNSNFKCEVIFVTIKFTEANNDYLSGFKKAPSKIVTLKQKEFEKISDSQSPQGIGAVFIKTNSKQDLNNLTDELVVYLDEISDPGNLGTIIRSCDWFGVTKILLSENCVEYSNPKVVRSSAGSIFHIDIFDNVGEVELRKLKDKGYRILAADVKGENIHEVKREGKIIVSFSNEANGPSEQILKITDKKITIPGKGKAESLNVASASAVILAFLTK